MVAEANEEVSTVSLSQKLTALLLMMDVYFAGGSAVTRQEQSLSH